MKRFIHDIWCSSIVIKIRNIFKMIKLYLCYLKCRKHFNKNEFKIMSLQETMDIIIKEKCSVIRFGDGEFLYINGKSIVYQNYDNKLAEQLKKILTENLHNNNILLCIPEPISNCDNLNNISKYHWITRIVKDKQAYQLLNREYNYGNSFISRPYMVYKDKSASQVVFKKFKQIWNNKKILIVEGEYSRNGVNNDLFDNSTSIERILCPSNDAYKAYDRIKKEIISFFDKKNKNEYVVLISLGPTAKPLIFDLAKLDLWCIDFGNIDSEYEWFKLGTKDRVIINNKHTAELGDFSVGKCDDVEYNKSIKIRVK